MEPFRNALSKSEKKLFGEMWDIPRLYASACSNSCQLVPLHPIIMSILFHHYKELKECINEIERIEAKVKGLYRYNSKRKELKLSCAVATCTTSKVIRIVKFVTSRTKEEKRRGS
jgi:hypothetical protein